MALLLTLLVVVLLVTVVLEFDRATRTTVRAAGNFRDGMKAFHLAASGVAAAQAVLKDDRLRRGSVDSLDEIWATPFPPYPLGDGTVAVTIRDETGKLNVNALVTPSGTKPTPPLQIERLKELFRLKGLNPALVDAIVDWLDRDEIEGPNGAESSYYAHLDHPYQCRNGPLETLAELHLIKGITDDVYRSISSFLTVYPTPLGAGYRINLNTADPLVIQASPFFEGGTVTFPLDAAQVEKIVAARPFTTVNQLNTVSGLEQRVVSQLLPLYAVTSSYFSVYSEGTANGVTKAVQAVIDRAGTQSIRYWRLAD